MKFNFKRDFHYVWLGDASHELNLIQYLSIKSILKYCKPDSITIWTETEFHGDYYDKIKDDVTLIKIEREKSIFGNPIIYTELHAWSDIYRNMIIYEYGGIYCDFDIIWCKDIDPLLAQIDTFGIADQGIDGREGCNMGVIIGEKGSEFCKLYLNLYQKYGEFEQKNHIALFSTRYPKELTQIHPNIATVLKYDTFHWPLYHMKSLEWFYFSNPDNNDMILDSLSGQKSSDKLENNYAHHCFGTHWDGIKGRITEEFIQTQDTSFTKKVRPILLWKK